MNTSAVSLFAKISTLISSVTTPTTWTLNSYRTLVKSPKCFDALSEKEFWKQFMRSSDQILPFWQRWMWGKLLVFSVMFRFATLRLKEIRKVVPVGTGVSRKIKISALPLLQTSIPKNHILQCFHCETLGQGMALKLASISARISDCDHHCVTITIAIYHRDSCPYTVRNFELGVME